MALVVTGAVLSEAEAEVVRLLAIAWNAFVALPAEHPDDVTEFRHGLHALQDKVLSRPTRRALNAAQSTPNDEAGFTPASQPSTPNDE